MIIYDISTAEKAMDTIIELTTSSKNDIRTFISGNVIRDDSHNDFVRLTGKHFLKEHGFKIANDKEILVCSYHYTSNDDACYSIMMNGLCDLSYSLSNISPLSSFLRENDIVFYIKNRILECKGTEYDITWEPNRLSLSDPLRRIAYKVYCDNGLTSFLHIDDINDYPSNITKYPEILEDLDRMFRPMKLLTKWQNQSVGYEIKFVSTIDCFNTPGFLSCNENLMESLINKALNVVALNKNYVAFSYLKPEAVVDSGNILSITRL